MGKITIESVLDELDITRDADGRKRMFGIRYVDANGAIGVIYNTVKPQRIPGPKNPNPDERGKTLYNLKYRGVVLLKNVDTDEFRSIKKANIIGFRPHNSEKWHQVWH